MENLINNISTEELLKQEYSELNKLLIENREKQNYLYRLEDEIENKQKIIKELLDLYKTKSYTKTNDEFKEQIESIKGEEV